MHKQARVSTFEVLKYIRTFQKRRFLTISVTKKLRFFAQHERASHLTSTVFGCNREMTSDCDFSFDRIELMSIVFSSVTSFSIFIRRLSAMAPIRLNTGANFISLEIIVKNQST